MFKNFMSQTNAALRGIETQMGQFASDLKGRQQGTLPSDTEHPKNGKEHVKAVTLRSSGDLVDIPIMQNEKETTHAFDPKIFPLLFPQTKATPSSSSIPSTSVTPTSSTTPIVVEPVVT